MSFFPTTNQHNSINMIQNTSNKFNDEQNKGQKVNSQNINQLLKITDQLTFKNALSFNNAHSKNQNIKQFVPNVQQYRFVSQVNQKQFNRNSYLSPQPSNNNRISSQTPIIGTTLSPDNLSKVAVQSNLSKKRSQQDMLSKLVKKIDKLQKQNIKLREENQLLKKRIISLQQKLHNNANNNAVQLQNNNNQNLAQVRSATSNQRKQLKVRSPFQKNPTQKANSLYMSGSPYKTKFSQSSASTNLLKQLLLECNQSKEFQSTKRSLQLRRSQFQKDQFYEYKNTRDCFQPFYNNLRKQLQLRLRKSMIRDKDLLYKDDYLQIGCLTSVTDQHSFKLDIVITNLLNQPLSNVNIAYLSNTDVLIQKTIKTNANIQIIKTTKNHTIYESVKSGEQLKQSLNITANNIDFRCILINIEFTDHKKQLKQISQILPASKHKLFRQKVFTPVPTSFSMIEKVIYLDKKLLPQIQKLKQYYKHVECTKDKNGNSEYMLKIQFLKKLFYVQMQGVGQQRIRIGIHHENIDSLIADKVLNQFIFIFER